MILFKNGNNGTFSDSLSKKAFIVMHSVLHEKCHKVLQIEKFKLCLHPHLCTADQVSVNDII